MTTLFLSMSIAAVVAAGLTGWMVRSRWQWAMDRPGERSLHSQPVPRTGGAAMMAAVVLAGAVAASLGAEWPWLETALAGLLCAVSLIDDKRGLPVAWRLCAHLGAALLYALILFVNGRGLEASLPPWLWLPLGVLSIVAVSNFYNFMDGANGLAGGMALIGFGTYAAAAFGLQPGLAALCCALAGGALGFLFFNWPGRIFMGDGGSVPLGFLAATLGISGWLGGAWAFWFPALVFAPFIVDASVTLLRRWRRGEPVWEAHREHYYQRVVRMGVSHGRLALAEYALMLACAAAALALPHLGALGQFSVVACTAALILGLMLLIDARWRRHGQHFPA